MRSRRRLPWVVTALAGLIALGAIPWRGSGDESTGVQRRGGSAIESGGQPGATTTGVPTARAAAIRIYLHQRPRDLHPHTAGYAAESQVTDCLFESLLTRDTGDIERYHPALAVRWERQDDGRTLVFHLRRDVHWHDGRAFTAADVAFTFEYVRDPQRHAPLGSFLATFSGCEVLDAHTVRFRLREASSRSSPTLASPALAFPTLVGRTFCILPRHCLGAADRDADSAFGRRPVGTGPYRLRSWDQDANRIELGRFAGYWGPKPASATVVFKTYTDRVAALADFRSGGLEFFPRVRPDEFFAWAEPAGWNADRVRAALEAGKGTFRLPRDVHARIRLGGFATSRVSFVAWNCRREPCREKPVRLALAHLLDRGALGGGCGLGRAVTGDQLWFGPAYDDTVKPHPFAPDVARRHLEAAGWFDRDGDGALDRDGKRLRVRIVYPAGADDAPLRQFAESARRIGVEVVLAGLERGRFTDAKKARDFDGLYLAWLLGPEEDPYWAWHSDCTADGINYPGYTGADRLIERVRRTVDPRERRALLRQLQARIHEAQPALFVQSATQLVAWSPRLEGVRFSPLTPTGWDVTRWKIGPGSQHAAR